MLIGGVISKILGGWIADRGLANIVGTLVFTGGFLSTFLYAVIAGPWHSTRPVPTKRSPKEQLKLRVRIFFGFVSAATVFFVLPIGFYMQNLSVLARVVGIGLSYAWAVTMGLDFGARIAKYDRENAKPAEPPSTTIA